MRTTTLTGLILLLIAPLAAGDEVVYRSTDRQTGLLELYTSEGCSSCPPADRWLSDLKKADGLWIDFIPVAFHVDYWDYIGWRDRFATPEAGARQRDYARQGGVGTVYTPGFIYNGEEWRGWFRGGTRRFPPSGQAGRLELRVDSDTADVIFDAADGAARNLRLTVALLGFGLESEVRAGENSGRQLRHDFVVLGTVTERLRHVEGAFVAAARLPTSDAETSNRAVVAWVSSGNELRPRQAVGGWLPAPGS